MFVSIDGGGKMVVESPLLSLPSSSGSYHELPLLKMDDLDDDESLSDDRNKSSRMRNEFVDCNYLNKK